MAAELERDDDVMDELHKRLFSVLLDESWQDGVESAIDVTLSGRYYERFCDHAVSVARRVVYLVTGEKPLAKQASSTAPGGEPANGS
jgi:phosphate transport system protein